MHILITGALQKTAVTRTSANGNTYVTASIRTLQKNRDGEMETVWASVIAFRDEARETLARLNAGDAVAVGGTCTVGIWERDGATYPSLSVVAESVAAARPAPRAPRPDPEQGSTRTRKPERREPPPAGPEDFDDEIPF